MWSIQMWWLFSMWIASPVPLPAWTLAIFRFRTMTLLTPFIDNPQPVRPESAPTPTMVVFDLTAMSPEQVRLPFTLMIDGPPLAPAADARAEALVTVATGPPPPTVLPPTVA